MTPSASTRSPTRVATKRPAAIDEAGGTPWDLAGRDDDRIGELRGAIRQLLDRGEAGGRVERPRRRLERTIEILKRARKEIYTMLAED